MNQDGGSLVGMGIKLVPCCHKANASIGTRQSTQSLSKLKEKKGTHRISSSSFFILRYTALRLSFNISLSAIRKTIRTISWQRESQGSQVSLGIKMNMHGEKMGLIVTPLGLSWCTRLSLYLYSSLSVPPDRLCRLPDSSRT
jgi:hypothetical protein